MNSSPASKLKSIYYSHKSASLAAIAALVCGMLTHLYVMTNKLYNYFEMGNIFSTMPYTKGDTFAMGRVFLPVVTTLSGYYSAAPINAVICMILIALAAFLITDLLKITSKTYAMLLGAVLVTFPGVASYLSYGVNSDLFCMSMLLAVLAVWFTEKYRFGIIGGIVCLCISIGCYQPFMSVSIALIFAVIFKKVLLEDITVKELFQKILRYVIMLVAAFVLYYVILQIALKISGITMGDYHGVNEMTSFSVKGIAKGFVYSYLYFAKYFFTTAYSNSVPALIMNVLAAAVLLFAIVQLIARKEKGKIWPILLLMLFPLGVNASPFLMADRVGNGVDNYMLFSLLVTYAILFAVLEGLYLKNAKEKKTYKASIYQWGSVIAAVIIVISGFYVCNMAYHRLDATTKEAANFLNRVAYRIEETKEWQEGMPVYVAGSNHLFNDYYEVTIPEFEKLTNISGTEVKPWYSYEAVYKYMKEYLHFPLREIDEEQAKQIEESEELAAMPVYPLEGSIAQIGDVLVVKLSEKTE